MNKKSLFQEQLDRYINNESRIGSFEGYSLAPARHGARLIGNPQNAFKTILITGTNGKGTVATCLHRLIREAGHSCGLYTSPHLNSIHERIITDREISDNQGLDILEFIQKKTSSIRLTWFDMMTLTAFEHFKREKVEYAVCETGLGGTLDSTTIADPVLSIITDISLDHTHILGSTVEKIARDKAGIIRKGIPVITSSQAPEIHKVISARAEEMGSPLSAYDQDYSITSQSSNSGKGWLYTDTRGGIREISINSPHFYTAKNIATATRGIVTLFPDISDDIIEKAVSRVSIPGRFELLSPAYNIYYDVAHNPASLTVMLDTVEGQFHSEVTLFFCCMMDKDPETLYALLKKRRHRIIYCSIPDPRCYIPKDKEVLSITDSMKIASRIDPSKATIFCGTFRMYPYMTDIIEKCGQRETAK